MASAACITTPPADLPQFPQLCPTIERASVVPSPAEMVLSDWPAEFDVPVQLPTVGAQFYYEVIYDSDFMSPVFSGFKVGGPEDGGVVLLHPRGLRPPLGGGCPHLIQFIVACSFTPNHVPDSPGGDEVDWYYAPGGGPYSCPTADAGSGAFPDAASDGLPVAPADAGTLDVGSPQSEGGDP